MQITAVSIFGLSFFSYGALLLPFLLVLFLFGIALGIFGSAVVLRFGPAAEWLDLAHSRDPLSLRRGVLSAGDATPTMDARASRGSFAAVRSYVFEGATRAMVAGKWSPDGRAHRQPVSLGRTLHSSLAGAFFIMDLQPGRGDSGLIARYSAEEP